MTTQALALTQPVYAPAPGGAPTLASTLCCICETDDADPVAVGEDFEYRSTPDTFLAVRCRRCSLVYLNPRPTLDELPRIYPPEYHAYDFSPERYGFVYRVRRALEAHRALRWCRGLGENARVLDVGCGDGFHLRLLRDFGRPGWQLEGVDSNERAVEAATRAGLTVHHGMVQQLELPRASYDLVLLIATIEHVDDPPGVLTEVRSLLRPGGRVVVVTDNTDSRDFRLLGARHWGGYHWPRHWNLFNPPTLRALADKVGLEVDELTTVVSPVNWVYSIHNVLVDSGAPRWLSNRFTLRSAGSLAVFTVLDTLHQMTGRGALLRAILRKPA